MLSTSFRSAAHKKQSPFFRLIYILCKEEIMHKCAVAASEVAVFTVHRKVAVLLQESSLHMQFVICNYTVDFPIYAFK